MGEPVESRQWTVEYQGLVDRNLFDSYEALNLSNCHTLESLSHIDIIEVSISSKLQHAKDSAKPHWSISSVSAGFIILLHARGLGRHRSIESIAISISSKLPIIEEPA
jgi:hypothetical protein